MLSTIESADGDDEEPRGTLIVAGRSVVRHQLDLALALECQRIVCLVRPGGAPFGALEELETRAAQAGARFHAITPGPRIAGFVSADDELLVLSDGLLAEPAAAVELMQAGQGVLTQPVEQALPAGFERLDINRGAAGIMLAPGKLVNRLIELPPDYDPVSALTRIALQAGVPMREIPDAVRGDRWTLVRSEADAQRLDDAWIALNLGDDRDATPTQIIARRLILSFGASLLGLGGGGGGSRMLAIGGGLLLMLSLGAIELGASATAFMLVALSVLTAQAAMLLMRVEQGLLEPEGTVAALTTAMVILTDAAIVLLIAWPAPRFSAATLVDGVFAPLVLVGLLRLVPRLFESRARAARWLQDRAIIAIVLAVSAMAGLTLMVTELMVLLMLAGALLRPLGEKAGTMD